MIRGAVPLSIEFNPVTQIHQPIASLVVPTEKKIKQEEQQIVAPLPPALVQFPGRRNPTVMPPTALPDPARPVAHFAPLPTMAIPLE